MWARSELQSPTRFSIQTEIQRVRIQRRHIVYQGPIRDIAVLIKLKTRASATMTACRFRSIGVSATDYSFWVRTRGPTRLISTRATGATTSSSAPDQPVTRTANLPRKKVPQPTMFATALDSALSGAQL